MPGADARAYRKLWGEPEPDPLPGPVHNALQHLWSVHCGDTRVIHGGRELTKAEAFLQALEIHAAALAEYLPAAPQPTASGQQEPPGLLRRALNFGTAIAGHVAAGLPLATPAEKARRLALCEGCVGAGGYFDPVARVCQHSRCGCFVDTKAGWDDQHCPIGRW